MKYENIKKGLQRVLTLIEDCERDGMSAIEYDLILNDLRDLYSAVRFDCQPFAGEEVKPDAEAAGEPSVELEVAPMPAIVGETVETTEAEVTEAEPAEVVSGEPETAEEAEAVTESVEITAAAAEVVPAFFKSDEESQTRRRMIVRSLYDDVAVEESEPEKSADEEIVEEQVQEAEVAEKPASEDAPVETRETEEVSVAVEPESESVAEPEPDGEAVSESDIMTEPEPEVVAESETMSETEPAAESVAQPESEVSPEPTEEMAEPSVSEPVQVSDEHRFAVETVEPVLGEVINADVQTFADTIAPLENSAADVVGKGAIAHLMEGVGINDRFLLIRDLFDGDTDAFEKTMAKLDSFGSLEDCMVHIVENYEWNPYCEGAKLLMTLVERRYASR